MSNDLPAQIRGPLQNLLNPRAPLGDTTWRHSKTLSRRLADAVREHLSDQASGVATAQAIVGTAKHLPLLELIGADVDGGAARDAALVLLHGLSEEQFADLLASHRVSTAAKAEALAHFVNRHSRFPAHCESLWSGDERSVKSGTWLLPMVLVRLSPWVLPNLFPRLSSGQAEALVVALLPACLTGSANRTALQDQLTKLLQSLDEQVLLTLLNRHCSELSHISPQVGAALLPRLWRLVADLPARPRRFVARIKALHPWNPHIDDARLSGVIDAWYDVFRILSSLQESKRPLRGLFARWLHWSRFDFRTLGESLARAMPRDVFPDDQWGTAKQAALRRLGEALVGKPFLPEPEIWKELALYFHTGTWQKQSNSPAAASAEAPPTSRPGPVKAASTGTLPIYRFPTTDWKGPAFVLVLGCAIGGGAIVGITHRRNNRLSAQNVNRQGDGAPSISPAPPVTPSESAPTSDPPVFVPPVVGGQDSAEPVVPPLDYEATPETRSSVWSTRRRSRRGAGANRGAPLSPLPPRTVAATEYVSLPKVDDETGHYPTTAMLKSWATPMPENVKLTLHGLDAVNKCLAAGTMFAESSGGSLVVSFRPKSAGHREETCRLAEFAVTPQGLEFRRATLTPGQYPHRCYREAVRACVLEIEVGSSTTYLALCEPLVLRPLRLRNCLGRPELSGLEKVAGLPANGLSLQLGHGWVQVDDGQGYRFGLAGGNPPFSVQDFGNDFGVADVRVNLIRDKVDPATWRVALEVIRDEQIGISRRERNSREKLLERVDKKLAQLDQLGRFELPTRNWVEVATDLARLLNLAPPGSFPEPAADLRTNRQTQQNYAAELKHYKQAVHEQVLDPARARRKELVAEIADLDLEIDVLSGPADRGEEELKRHTTGFEAVLYRFVDSIRVDAVVIGDPDAASPSGQRQPVR